VSHLVPTHSVWLSKSAACPEGYARRGRNILAHGQRPGKINRAFYSKPQRGVVQNVTPKPKGDTMPQSLARILVHIVFSTKHRQPLIKSEIENELFPYMASIFRAYESPAIIINGVEDHVHILCVLSRKMALSDLIEEVKKSSSKWIKTKGAAYKNFYWQNGYGAFSIGESNVEMLKAYIAKQKEHHRQKTFQDEFREFLKLYKIEYDEKYVWD
jgi:REP element-mobilizing transposase RayT